jgi:hypothetical protein
MVRALLLLANSPEVQAFSPFRGSHLYAFIPFKPPRSFMKRTKRDEPSVAGLLLIVTGMLLLSMLLLTLLGNSTGQNRGLLIGTACAGVLAVAAGTVLSSRKKK